jgi:hypothetical protein
MDAIERPVIIPAAEVIVHRAAWRQVLGQRSPLTTRAQDIHQPVDYLSLIDGPLVTTSLGGRDQRPDQSPLLISHITRVTQLAAVIPTAVFVRPHRAAPANQTAAIESQMTPTIQDVPGQMGWTAPAASVCHDAGCQNLQQGSRPR